MNKIILLILILSFQVNLYSANHIVKMLNQGAEGVMIFEPSVLKINPGDEDAPKIQKVQRCRCFAGAF